MEPRQFDVRARRDPARPIIEPRAGDRYWWEKNGTFNPGVAEYEGKIVLLYRAYDDFHISRLGLAVSDDGLTFQRFDQPVIDTDPDDPHERLGIEDPRVTRVGDTYYILHTSASYHRVGEQVDPRSVMGYLPWRVRVGMHTTHNFQSFIHHGIIFPHIPAKNSCLLPERVDGRFAVYYREYGATGGQEVMKLAFTNDFSEWFDITPVVLLRREVWQNYKIGFGAPPLLTPEGWLMVYHAMDEDKVYRLGLLLLDRKNPARVVGQIGPIMQPEMSYELNGFIPNVVYCCGALMRGDELWLYYGGGDRVIGRAIVDLRNLPWQG